MRPAALDSDSSSADFDSLEPEDFLDDTASSTTSASTVGDLEDLISGLDAPEDQTSDNSFSFQRVWQEEQDLIAQNRELRRWHRRSAGSQAARPQPHGHAAPRCPGGRVRADPSEAEVPMQQTFNPEFHFGQAHSPTGSRSRFSVALSGGGVRAAAFQAGALWRLAESGHMRDIDYIAAVSGGSYIAAAFASHIVEAGRPTPGESVDAWYRNVVARTICRMQRNTPYLARDLGKDPWNFPKDGSSLLPRVLDIPILLTLFLVNSLMTPAFYAVFILLPAVEMVNMFVGGELRWMFCNDLSKPGTFALFYPNKVFNVRLSLQGIWKLLCGGLVISFLFWSLAKVPLKEEKRRSKGSRRRRRIWLFMKSATSVTVRLILVMVIGYAVVLSDINYRMWWSERGPGYDRLCMCHRYALLLRNHSINNQYMCADNIYGEPFEIPWYNNTNYNATRCQDEKVLGPARTKPQSNDTVAIYRQCGGEGYTGGTVCMQGLVCVSHNRWYSQCLPAPTETPPLIVKSIDVKHPLQSFVLMASVVFLVAVLLIPFFPKLYGFVLGLLGPLTVFIIVVAMLDLRVFGALYGGEGAAHHIDWATRAILVLDILALPFQHMARGCCHRVYRRSLRKAFFAGGQDSTWGKLSANPYCPCLLLSATINEFMRPGDSIPLSEISLSPLHVGSQKTGYIRMSSGRSLARSVALSGAAIDAFVLGKNDRIKNRFWLEMMSLSMGDFMLFDQRAQSWRHSESGMYVMLRLPAMIIGECFYGMMLFGGMASFAGRCRVAYRMYELASLVALVTVGLSFFAWLPCLDPLLHCGPIRGIHVLTQFYHRSETPPSLVCVTDGGLLDNTGVMQLLRRQCRRILLIYGGNDPKGKFKWLRKVLDAAGNERLASFHDPRDPGRDFREIIQDFNEDPSQSCIHLRIRYGWRDNDQRVHGDFYIVTNRMPAECMNMNVEPLLMEKEICGLERIGEISSDMEKLKMTDLGGCCCDCCHSHGCNFGPKFPNTHQMNQCLTPQLFNSLCRLGRHVSKDAVDLVTGPPRHPARADGGGGRPP